MRCPGAGVLRRRRTTMASNPINASSRVTRLRFTTYPWVRNHAVIRRLP